MDITREEAEISIILREMYDRLAKEFNISEEYSVYYCLAPKEEIADGIIRHDCNEIWIDSGKVKTLHHVVSTMYHEFRHAFQARAFNGKYKHLLVDWSEDWDFYMKYRDEFLCIPELDAKWFGDSQGECRGLVLLDCEEDFYHLLKQDPSQLDELNEHTSQLLLQHFSEKDKPIRFPDLEAKLCKYLPDKSSLEILLGL